MARGKEHEDTTKAAVVAALLAGQGVTQIAKDLNLPKSTVSRIKTGLGDQLEQVGTEKADRMGDLVVDYLEELLVTLREQAIFFRDRDWLKRQSASDAAVLHGVAADKAIRILEAAEANIAPEDVDATEA